MGSFWRESRALLPVYQSHAYKRMQTALEGGALGLSEMGPAVTFPECGSELAEQVWCA